MTHDDAVPRRRHVWVDSGIGTRNPGLVLAWRAGAQGVWEAHVVVVQTESVLLTWVPATQLHPVTDGRSRDPGPSQRLR